MSDLFKDLAREAGDLSSTPSEAGSAKLREAGMELCRLDVEISRLEESLEAKRARRNEIVSKDMPALMEKVGQDRIGLPEAYEHGADLVLKPYYHANIAADWEPEAREAAFKYLQDRDAGDLVKTALTVVAGRGDLKKMQRLQQRVTQMLAELDITGAVGMDLTVPWNSLTAWLRGQVTSGEVVDLKTIGATVGQVVEIKKRKPKK